MRRSDDSKRYLIECYWPGLTEGELTSAMRRVQGAASELDTAAAGAAVTLLGSILMPGDETVFLLFQGDEREIRNTALNAGIPVERVVEASWRGPELVHTLSHARSAGHCDSAPSAAETVDSPGPEVWP